MTPPRIVLDTNALLDWCVFNDPLMHPVARAIEHGALQWLASPSMQREWHLVWPRPVFERWHPDPQRAQAIFGHAWMVDEPVRGPLRCKDPDDQVFIDLSLQRGARWLVTKDAALLKLARRARLLGCDILTPQAAALAVLA